MSLENPFTAKFWDPGGEELYFSVTVLADVLFSFINSFELAEADELALLRLCLWEFPVSATNIFPE